MTSTAAKLANLFSRAATTELVKALRDLDTQPSTQERNWARARIITELERRHPAASEAVGKAFDEAGDNPVDYVAVLTAAVTKEI